MEATANRENTMILALFSRPGVTGMTITLLQVFILIAVVGIFAEGAFAEGQVNSDRERDGVIEEIVVSARKRDESLQSVAVAVSAFSGAFIEKAGIKNILDLSLYSPGLTVSNNHTAGRVYIRGVGNNIDFLGSQSAVATHLDGVYQSRPWGVYYDFLDVERVEVLRGPQGTIYGRNATGGAINIISKLPTEELTAKAEASTGNYSSLSLGGTISSALSDSVKGRFTVSSKTHDGVTDNLVPGMKNLGDEDVLAVRGELDFVIGDTVDLRILGNFMNRNVEGPAVVPSTDGLAANLGAQSNVDPFRVSHNTDTYFDAENFGLSAILSWDINDVLTLESISAYAENDIAYDLDTDGTEVDVIHFPNSEIQDQFSQELRILGGSADSRFEWQGGLYYLNETTDDVGTVFITAFDLVLPVGGSVDGDAYAVYAQSTYALTDRLGLTTGLRYNSETKKVYNHPTVNEETSWHDWTPHIGLEFQASDNTFWYASITKGFKSGGYNVLGGAELVQPENIWNYEVGSKLDLLGRKLRLNTSVFYAEYSDQQVNAFIGAGISRLENAAESTIYGAEIELFAVPADTFEFGANLGYLNAKFDRYLAADPFQPNGVDLAGSRMSNAPEWTATIFGDYSVTTASGGELWAHLDYGWQDDVKYDVFDDPTTTQSAFGLLNANLAYTFQGSDVTLSLWGRNLTDEVYYTSHAKLNFTPTGVISWTGEPRTYGIKLTYDY